MTAKEMQRRSAAARWGGKSAEEKQAAMSALAKARWAKIKRKPKASVRRSNDQAHLHPPGGNDGAQNK
mgnify:CR=1 FL=1